MPLLKSHSLPHNPKIIKRIKLVLKWGSNKIRQTKFRPSKRSKIYRHNQGPHAPKPHQTNNQQSHLQFNSRRPLRPPRKKYRLSRRKQFNSTQWSVKTPTQARSKKRKRRKRRRRPPKWTLTNSYAKLPKWRSKSASFRRSKRSSASYRTKRSGCVAKKRNSGKRWKLNLRGKKTRRRQSNND